MASNTTYGDWMRPMPGGIRNIGIPLTIAGMGVLTCTLLVSMASVVAAIAILVVGMGVILVLAIRDREHRNMVDRAVEKRTWMAAQRTGANLYRSGLLAPIDGGKAMLPGILSRVVLTSALDGLGREFCLVRHAHTANTRCSCHASRRARASPTTTWRTRTWPRGPGSWNRSPPRPASPNWP